MQISTRRLFDMMEIGNGSSTNRINDMRQKKALKELQKQQYREYQTYELTFAQSLGVNLKSPIEWVHLVPIAVKALYQLPAGYEVCIGSDEYENLPYFFDNKTETSYWHHPFEAQIKVELSRIIEVENIVAVEPHQEIEVSGSVDKSIAEEPGEDSPYKLFEVLFALNYNVDPSLEGHQKYLMSIVVEMLYDLPDEYRLYLGEEDHGNFPFFHNVETKESVWAHPRDEEIRQALVDASRKYGLQLLQQAEIDRIIAGDDITTDSISISPKLDTSRNPVSAVVATAKDHIRRLSTPVVSYDPSRPLTGVQSSREVLTRRTPANKDRIEKLFASLEPVPMPMETYSHPSSSRADKGNFFDTPKSSKSKLSNARLTPNHGNRLPPNRFSEAKISPAHRDAPASAPSTAVIPNLSLPIDSNNVTTSGKIIKSASKTSRGLTKLIVDSNGNQIPISVMETPTSQRSDSSYSSYVSYGSDESYSTYDDTTTGFNTERDSEYTSGPQSTRSRMRGRRSPSEPPSPITFRDGSSLSPNSPASPSRSSNKFKFRGSGKYNNRNDGIAGGTGNRGNISPKKMLMGGVGDDLSTIVSVGSETDSHAPKSIAKDAQKSSYSSSPKNVSIAPRLASIPDITDVNISPLSNDATFFAGSVEGNSSLDGQVEVEAVAEVKQVSLIIKHQPLTATTVTPTSVSGSNQHIGTLERAKSLKKEPSPHSMDNKRKSTAIAISNSNGKVTPSKDRNAPSQKRPSLVASLAKNTRNRRGSHQLSTSAESTIKLAAIISHDAKNKQKKKILTSTSAVTQTGASLLEGDDDDEEEQDEVVLPIDTDTIQRRKSIISIGSIISHPIDLHQPTSYDDDKRMRPAPVITSARDPMMASSDAAPFLSPQSYVTYGSADTCSIYDAALVSPAAQHQPISLSSKNIQAMKSPTQQPSSSSSAKRVGSQVYKSSSRPAIATTRQHHKPSSSSHVSRSKKASSSSIEASYSMMTDTLSESASISSPSKKIIITSSSSSKRASSTSRRILSSSSKHHKNDMMSDVKHDAAKDRVGTSTGASSRRRSSSASPYRQLISSSPAAAIKMPSSCKVSLSSLSYKPSSSPSRRLSSSSMRYEHPATRMRAVMIISKQHEPDDKTPSSSSSSEMMMSNAVDNDAAAVISSLEQHDDKNHHQSSSSSSCLPETIAAAVALVDDDHHDDDNQLPIIHDAIIDPIVSTSSSSSSINKIKQAKKHHNQHHHDDDPASVSQSSKFPTLPSLHHSNDKDKDKLQHHKPSSSSSTFRRISLKASKSSSKLSSSSSSDNHHDDDNQVHDARIKFLSRSVRIPQSSSSSSIETRYPAAMEVSKSLTVLPQITQLLSSSSSNMISSSAPSTNKNKISSSSLSDRNSPTTHDHLDDDMMMKSSSSSPMKPSSSSPVKKMMKAHQHPLWPASQPYETWKVLTACDTLYCAKLIRSKLLRCVNKIQRQSLYHHASSSMISSSSSSSSSKLDMIQLTYGGHLNINDLIRLRLDDHHHMKNDDHKNDDDHDGDMMRWVVETSSMYVYKVFYDMESNSYKDDAMIKASSDKQKMMYQMMMTKMMNSKDNHHIHVSSSTSYHDDDMMMISPLASNVHDSMLSQDIKAPEMELHHPLPSSDDDKVQMHGDMMKIVDIISHHDDHKMMTLDDKDMTSSSPIEAIISSPHHVIRDEDMNDIDTMQDSDTVMNDDNVAVDDMVTSSSPLIITPVDGEDMMSPAACASPPQQSIVA